MASQEFLKLLDNFEEKPSGTLREWQRVLNHILDNLSSGSYVTTDAVNVNIADAGSFFTTKNVEYALQVLALGLYGGQARITTKTGSANLTTSEFGVVYCNSASAMTLGLPTGLAFVGYSMFISNINAGVVTVNPDGAETIFGDATFDLYEGETINIIYDGTAWNWR
jgi:hypothetical protein